MNVLALETATENCSVALAVGDEHTQLLEFAPQQQANLLLPMVDRLLAESEVSRHHLDVVAFGCGPGSFTGLRIAAAACQGIALGLSLPVARISTLAALAHQRYRVADVQHSLACLDARMNEVYWGRFETTALGATREVDEERVESPAVLAQTLIDQFADEPIELSGSGASLVADAMRDAMPDAKPAKFTVVDALPEAMDVLALALPVIEAGELLTPDQAIPVYLRDRVALTEAERGLAKK